jgi:hypothetical protein
MSHILHLKLVIFGEYRMERELFLARYYYVCLFVVVRGGYSTSKDPRNYAVVTRRTSLAGGTKREKPE